MLIFDIICCILIVDSSIPQLSKNLKGVIGMRKMIALWLSIGLLLSIPTLSIAESDLSNELILEEENAEIISVESVEESTVSTDGDIQTVTNAIVLTGKDFNDENFTYDANAGGAFNGNFGSYLLVTTGSSARYTNCDIVIPESGMYYVGARMKTTTTPVTQTNYHMNRTMQVSFTQNSVESFVTGSNPWSDENMYDFDSCDINGQNRYLFGSMREFVTDLQSYNYFDAVPVYLEEGQATVNLYANSYSRLDFLVISEQPLVNVQTKTEYQQTYGVFENTTFAFLEEPAISVQEGNSWLEYEAGPNKPVAYEISFTDTYGTNSYSTKEHSLNLSSLCRLEPVTIDITAWDAFGNFLQETITYNPGNDNYAIVLNAETEFVTGSAFTDNIPSAGIDYMYSAYSFSKESGGYTVLNNNYGEPLKHTTEIFVPVSGNYYVSARALSQKQESNDPKFGTFMISYYENGVEKYVQGDKAVIESDQLSDYEDYNALMINDEPRYLFGARRSYVTAEHKPHMYTDAEPIYLDQGFNTLNIYAYPGSIMDFIILASQPMSQNMNEAMYEASVGAVLNYPSPYYSKSGYQVENEEVVFEVEGTHIDGYAVYGIGSNGTLEAFGYYDGNVTDFVAEGLYDSSYNSMIFTAFNRSGKRAEDLFSVPSSKTTILLTPRNNFTVHPTDAEFFGEDVWFKSISGFGVYNSNYGNPIIQAKDKRVNDRKQVVRMTATVQIPKDGQYEISARAASSANVQDSQKPFERVFGITVKQGDGNEIPITSNVGDANFDITYDRITGGTRNLYNLYGFGMKRDFVTSNEYDFYNYDEAEFVTLEEGEATITFYGYGYARLDYLTITDYDIILPDTQEGYDATLAKYEDMNLPYFTFGPSFSRTEEGIYVKASADDLYSHSATIELHDVYNGDDVCVSIGIGSLEAVLPLNENSKNHEGYILLKSAKGYTQKQYIDFSDFSDAEETYNNGETIRYFDYETDRDYYKFPVSRFATRYNITMPSNSQDASFAVYKKNQGAWEKVEPQNGGYYTDESDTDVTHFYVKTISGRSASSYQLQVIQDISVIENGRLVKYVKPGEKVYVSVTAKEKAEGKTVMVIEYDAHMLELTDDEVDNIIQYVIPNNHGATEIIENSAGILKIEYTTDDVLDESYWGGLVHVLEFTSKVEGHINLKCYQE